MGGLWLRKNCNVVQFFQEAQADHYFSVFYFTREKPLKLTSVLASKKSDIGIPPFAGVNVQ